MPKTVKSPQLALFVTRLARLAWRISGPHISTLENLHAKQEAVFSAILRAFLAFFRQKENFGDLAQNFTR